MHFDVFFKELKKSRRLRTDRGGEFTGRKVQDYFDSINVEHWTAHNDEMKANFAEGVIRTLTPCLLCVVPFTLLCTTISN